jgi:hypothetical protein
MAILWLFEEDARPKARPIKDSAACGEVVAQLLGFEIVLLCVTFLRSRQL